MKPNLDFLNDAGPLAPSLKLTHKQEQAAKLLAEGNTQTKAADEVGVTKQTLNRWVKDPLMRKRIEELRLDVVKQADEILNLSIPKAAETVANLAAGELDFVDSKVLNPRLRAALYILDRHLKAKLPKVKTTERRSPSNDYDEDEDVTSGFDDAELDDLIERTGV